MGLVLHVMPPTMFDSQWIARARAETLGSAQQRVDQSRPDYLARKEC